MNNLFKDELYVVCHNIRSLHNVGSIFRTAEGAGINMKLILKQNNRYILRIDRGEEFIESLRKFCKEERINAGYFSAVGASEEAELAYFDLETKKYLPKNFQEAMEIVSIIGNVAWKDNEIIIHAHGVLGNKKMQLFGGHINKLLISTIAEVHLLRLEGKIKRKHSAEIGLNIMG